MPGQRRECRGVVRRPHNLRDVFRTLGCAGRPTKRHRSDARSGGTESGARATSFLWKRRVVPQAESAGRAKREGVRFNQSSSSQVRVERRGVIQALADNHSDARMRVDQDLCACWVPIDTVRIVARPPRAKKGVTPVNARQLSNGLQKGLPCRAWQRGNCQQEAVLS